jgi:hypothetical protein
MSNYKLKKITVKEKKKNNKKRTTKEDYIEFWTEISYKLKIFVIIIVPVIG